MYRRPGEVAEPAAGLLDDHGQPGEVPRAAAELHARLDTPSADEERAVLQGRGVRAAVPTRRRPTAPADRTSSGGISE